MADFVTPGHRAVTPTGEPRARSSARNASLIASTACFVAAYGAIAGAARQAAAEAVLTTWPSACATRAGTKVRMPWITPNKFTFTTQRQSVSGVSHDGPRCP